MFINLKLNCMKNYMIICIIALAAMMTGCASLPAIPFEQNANYIDYAAFPGMFISESNSVGFEYKPLASLYAEELSGAFKVVKKEVTNDEIYGTSYQIVDGKTRKANPQSALAFAIEKAREMGGNGIINLKIQRIGRGYAMTVMMIRR